MPDFVSEHFEWNVEKSEEIYARHGFDFHIVAEMFERQAYVHSWVDLRLEDEERMIAIGRSHDLFITAVYTMRDSRKRIITAWKSKRREIDEYARQKGYRDDGKD